MNKELYVIATPIGNLKEASTWLIETLQKVEILFCEDTRVTANILHLLQIKNKPKLISYHKFNENQITDQIVEHINHNICGLISDAGYPCICDPGYNLIKKCHELNIKVNIVNGPCAINHAIVQSGFSGHGFIFIGFLPNSESAIIQVINKYKSINLPIVCFESVHRINKTISILKKIIPNELIYIGRELSKKFEEYVVTQISDVEEITLKGEFTLAIQFQEQTSDESIDYIDELKLLTKHGMRFKDACKYLCDKSNKKVNAKEIYEMYLPKFKKENE